MAIPESLKTAFSKGDFDSVESAWIERMDEAIDDLDFFVGCGRALVGQGQEEMAKMLFRLLEDELIDSDRNRTWMHLLRRTGSMFHQPRALQEAAVDCLRALHGSHGRFDDLLRVAGLKKNIKRDADLWRRVGNLLSLLDFDVGTFVTMEGQGVGRILDTNTDLETFRIEFPATDAMNVGFRAAAKMLTAIPENSLRYRLVTEPEAAQQVIDDEPHLLLEEVLREAEAAMSGADIKKALAGVLPSKQWNRWWNAARKHPQVVSDSQKRNSYRWAASDEHAEEALLSRFQRADLDGKLRVLTEARDRPEVLDEVTTALREGILENGAADPVEVAVTWVRLRRVNDEMAGDVPAILAEAESRDLAAILARIEPQTDRRTAYELLTAEREDWQQVVEALLEVEAQPRLAGELVNALPAETREQALLEVVRRANKSPAAFVWIAEQSADNEDLRAVLQPVLLLRKLINARSQDAFTDFRPRLAAMFRSGGVVPRLLAELDEEQATQVYRFIDDSRLVAAEKAGLTTALETRFPALRQSTAIGLYALRGSIERRREELRHLKEEEIPANRKAVEEAAALGDLRENFEYKSARERQEYLSARVARLEAELAQVQPLDLTQAGDDEVRIGSVVTLSGDPELRFTVLGPWESEPDDGIISYESELGSDLLGKRQGDRIIAGGEEREVRAIGIYSPDEGTA